MASKSKIEWTDDTWNPVVGCSKVSSGCAHCYAERTSNRLAGMARADVRKGRNPGRKANYLNVLNGHGKFNGKVICIASALQDPLHWRTPRKVFVNSMSDLFHETVPFAFIDKVFAVMALCPQHTFQVLTKRPERMAEYFCTPPKGFHPAECVSESRTPGILWACRDIVLDRRKGGPPSFDRIETAEQNWNYDLYVASTTCDTEAGPRSWPIPNVHLGTSVENQKQADIRIPYLLKCPAAMRFVSAEPLLERIDLRYALGDEPSMHYAGICPEGLRPGRIDVDSRYPHASYIDQVIVGGESGPGARPCNIEDIRSIVQQGKAAGVPVFVKQLGSNAVYDEEGDHKLAGYPFKTKHSKGGDMGEWPEDLRGVRDPPRRRRRNDGRRNADSGRHRVVPSSRG